MCSLQVNDCEVDCAIGIFTSFDLVAISLEYLLGMCQVTSSFRLLN